MRTGAGAEHDELALPKSVGRKVAGPWRVAVARRPWARGRGAGGLRSRTSTSRRDRLSVTRLTRHRPRRFDNRSLLGTRRGSRDLPATPNRHAHHKTTVRSLSHALWRCGAAGIATMLAPFQPPHPFPLPPDSPPAIRPYMEQRMAPASQQRSLCSVLAVCARTPYARPTILPSLPPALAHARQSVANHAAQAPSVRTISAPRA